MKRCSICNTQITDADLFFTCTVCNSPYHEICWKEMGGCATYGCKAAAAAEKPPVPRSFSRGWGDEKISGILVGVVLGLALATTPVGPPILHAVKVASEAVFTAISAAVQ